MIHTAAVLLALALIRLTGERWWAGIALIFMPRVLWLAPTVVLAVAAARTRRRLWGLQALTALVVLGPLMGLSLPWRTLGSRSGGFGRLRLRIMTFNRGMAPIDSTRLIRLIEQSEIDIICLQEGLSNPVMRAYWRDHRWYRTDFVASRFPIRAVSRPLAGAAGAFPRWRTRLESVRVQAADGPEFAVVSVHLDTIRHGLEMFRAGGAGTGLRRHTAWRVGEVQRLAALLNGWRGPPLLVGGDFNMPADSATFAPLTGRARLCFETAGWGYGFTYPTRWPWVRIDHLLAGPEWTVRRCWVGPDLGSDHLPLIAEVTLRAPPRVGSAHGESSPPRSGTGTAHPGRRPGWGG